MCVLDLWEGTPGVDLFEERGFPAWDGTAVLLFLWMAGAATVEKLDAGWAWNSIWLRSVRVALLWQERPAMAETNQ
eukprot:4653949-Ditylum_brightwellii.AAC.1